MKTYVSMCLCGSIFLFSLVFRNINQPDSTAGLRILRLLKTAYRI